MTVLWLEVVEAVGIALLVLLPLLWLWGRLDHRSPRAALVRRVAGVPGARHVFLAVVAASLFAILAEAVLDDGSHERLVQVDLVVRDSAVAIRGLPALRDVAALISDLTGTGLAIALLLVTGGLLFLRRRRDAFVIAAGTLSAWLLSAVLKLAFAIPRPRGTRPVHAITGYGFPSAHALMAVVAFGLLAWLIARGAAPAIRRGLYAAVTLGALVTGTARVVLDAHRVTDVMAGFAVGLVWLNVVLLFSQVPSGNPDPARAS